jgi:hypothetical protein
MSEVETNTKSTESINGAKWREPCESDICGPVLTGVDKFASEGDGLPETVSPA